MSEKTTLADSKEMMECMELLQRWHDIGMLSGDGDPDDDVKTREEMMEGNTLFIHFFAENLVRHSRAGMNAA